MEALGNGQVVGVAPLRDDDTMVRCGCPLLAQGCGQHANRLTEGSVTTTSPSLAPTSLPSWLPRRLRQFGERGRVLLRIRRCAPGG